MSITPELQAAARSAYRALWRAASTTFAGDDKVLSAFRSKMRSDAHRAQAEVNSDAYSAQNQHATDVALFLRRNVVQGIKVGEQADKETWNLRFTKDTELGNNDSIKNPPPRPNGRKRHATSCSVASHNDAPPGPPQRLNYSVLKKVAKQRMVPELNEEDLEETFVRGSGPGGQSVNKTENNVQIIHKPTGIRVTCHETRSLSLNRLYARRRLIEKLDSLENPGFTKADVRRARQHERERQRRKKAKKKQKKTLDIDIDM